MEQQHQQQLVSLSPVDGNSVDLSASADNFVEISMSGNWRAKLRSEARAYLDLCAKSLGPIGSRFVQSSRDFVFSVIASNHATYLGEMNLPLSIYNALYYTSMAPLQTGKLIVGERDKKNNSMVGSSDEQSDDQTVACYYVAGLGYVFIASILNTAVLVGAGFAFGLQDGSRLLMNTLSAPLAMQLVTKLNQQVMLGVDDEIKICCVSLDGSHINFLTTAVGSGVSILSLWLGLGYFELPAIAYAMGAGLLVNGAGQFIFVGSTGKVLGLPVKFRQVGDDLWKIIREGAAPALQTGVELITYLGALPWWAYKQGLAASKVLQVSSGVLDSFVGSITNIIPIGITRQMKGNLKDPIKLRAIGHRGVGLTAFVSGIFLVVFLAIPRLLMGMFTQDEDALALSESVLRLVCTGQALYNIRYAQETVLRMGYNDTIPALATAVLATGLLLAVCIPLNQSLSFDTAIFAGTMGLSLALIATRYFHKTNPMSFWSRRSVTESSHLLAVNDSTEQGSGNARNATNENGRDGVCCIL